ncbi:MAG: extracellular solute-binding protein [Spirochaetaceae bacterium]|jgi:putative aldouronate transport system substrate-binding protein|nr:extracellular solute-binding protein [Spirochaetaceae bacterium]
MQKYSRYILYVVLVTALLSACQKKDDQQGGANAGAKPVEITVEVFDRGTDGGKTDPANNEWTKWIQEKVLKDENIIVKFKKVPRWEEVEALNAMVAAGDLPDVCLSYSSELIANYRDLGGLFDMAPHVDTTLKDLKAFLGPDTALPGRDLIRRNENPQTKQIFSIPARRTNVAMRNMFIRKDWLDKLGMPLPTTTEEFYAALKAFKEQDPGNVGRDRVVPFIMTNNAFWGLQTIAYAFIDPNISRKERWTHIVVDRYLLVPGYKEGIRFANRMFNEGLIDPDFPLHKEDDVYNAIKSGVVGAYSDNWDMIYRESQAILSDLQKNVPDAEMVPVDCLTGAASYSHKSAYDPAGVNFFVPVTSKNPEAALRYVNWLARFENYNFLQIGPEGVTHEVVDGVPKIKTVTGPWIQNSPQNIDYTYHINGLDLNDEAKNARALASGYPWPAEIIENSYNIAMNNAAPDPVVPVPLSAAGPVMQTLTDRSNVILTQAVTSSPANFEQVWERGIQEWLSSGAQAVVDERIEKYFE